MADVCYIIGCGYGDSPLTPAGDCPQSGGSAPPPSLQAHTRQFPPFFAQHIMIDLGTGNNNKINWAIPDKQEVIDIVETVYRGARKGRGLVVSPKDYSTKYRY